jgi:hypothetical protein
VLKNLANARLFSPIDMLERPCTIENTDVGVKLTFTLGEYETLIAD